MARAFSIQFKKKNNPQKIYERTNIGKGIQKTEGSTILY